MISQPTGGGSQEDKPAVECCPIRGILGSHTYPLFCLLTDCHLLFADHGWHVWTEWPQWEIVGQHGKLFQTVYHDSSEAFHFWTISDSLLDNLPGYSTTKEECIQSRRTCQENNRIFSGTCRLHRSVHSPASLGKQRQWCAPSTHVGTTSLVAANCDNSNFSVRRKAFRARLRTIRRIPENGKKRSQTRKNVCRQLSSTLLSKWINPGYRPGKMGCSEKGPVCGMINAAHYLKIGKALFR